MKSKRSEIICIILAVILLFIGMCSQMGRVDSLVASFQSAHEADVVSVYGFCRLCDLRADSG